MKQNEHLLRINDVVMSEVRDHDPRRALSSQPADHLLTSQVGWESRALHGVLRSQDLKLTVGKKDAAPVCLPLPDSNK